MATVVQGKITLPSFLVGTLEESTYRRWLVRKAVAHVKRDRARGNEQATWAEYRDAIHAAVLECRGLDAYTGKDLDWGLVSTYDNKKSKDGRREYKKQFADLPTVDHVGDGRGAPVFKICSWRVNDAKGDLTLAELQKLCVEILARSEARPDTPTVDPQPYPIDSDR